MALLTRLASLVYTTIYTNHDGSHMQKAKLFTNGRSQAVRLPKEFRLPGDEVYIRKEGKNVVLIPIDDHWQPFVDSLGAATDDFMAEREQGEQEVREDVFRE